MSEYLLTENREQLARNAMCEALKNQQAEDSVELFIQHHLEEVEAEYWQKHFGTNKPTTEQVLNFLVLNQQGEREELENYDVLDFTLPEDITDYVISISFNHQGQVVDISMES